MIYLLLFLYIILLFFFILNFRKKFNLFNKKYLLLQEIHSCIIHDNPALGLKKIEEYYKLDHSDSLSLINIEIFFEKKINKKKDINHV